VERLYTAGVLYSFLRAVIGAALRLFYKVGLTGSTARLDGPIMFVGNHPNALIDPALIFVLTPRQVTFLAKAPLFRIPLLGLILKGIDALPVYRKQDNPALMQQNEGTLEAAAEALLRGRAITLFPEGRSHSEPQLGELKTGAARIALRAARQGAKVRVVPVGLTYEDKHLFRSEVLIDVGEPIEAAAFVGSGSASGAKSGGAEEVAEARALTEAIATGLRKVTLNLEAWEELPLLKTAESLYAFKTGGAVKDADRLRRFARGAQLLRAEQPARYEKMRSALRAFRRRLSLGRATPTDLTLAYHPAQVARFVLRNLGMLFIGLPLAALGFLLFWLPYEIPGWVTDVTKPELDTQATIKFIATLVVAPLWLLVLFAVGAWGFSPLVGLWAVAAAAPLALFTRWFVEHWEGALRDIRVFFTLGSRARLKGLLLSEGERLANEVEQLATELGPRADPATLVRG